MEAFSNEAADDSRELMDQLAVENRERYDYRKFLQKFSVLKETVQIDPDAFDYVFYNYGMQLYGNMPLIEPLETKEVRRIEDFVVVIDTSMSCSGELVKKFLEETYGVLAQSESFFKKVNIHILQCDDKVRAGCEDRERGGPSELHGPHGAPWHGRDGFPPGIPACGPDDQGGKVQQAAGTSLFYGRIWDISGENAAI